MKEHEEFLYSTARELSKEYHKNESLGSLRCKTKNLPSREYDIDGRLELEVPYKNGLKYGLAIGYYPNGKLRYEVEYENNLRHGISKSYYEDGSLELEIPFVNGQRDGISKHYVNGKLAYETIHKNGKLVESIKL